MRYSINDLEKITGIKAHTIRMWEKRYNVICPSRTQTNIRYYHDKDLRKLLNISTLNKHGFRISQIAHMDEDNVRDKIVEISGTSGDHESQINGLIVSMIEINETAFNQVLTNTILKLGFEATVTYILYPLLEKIGVLWQIGTINPAQEHFIINLIRQKLIIAIDGQNQPPKKDAKTFLLYLPEGEMHEMGLLFFHYIIRKNGHRVIYLGQSVPFSSLEDVLKVRQADFLVTYFVAALKDKDIPDYLKKLSGTFNQQKILVAGLQMREMKLRLPSNVFLLQNADSLKDYLQDL